MDIGDNPDYVHPEKKQKFAARTHPMAKHKSYPDFRPQPGQKETNWEETVASRQYRDTLGRLKTFFGRIHPGENLNLTSVLQAMMQGLKDAMEFEKPYRRALEKLGIELVLDQPEFKALKDAYEAGDFTIDAKLGVFGDLTNAKFSGEDEDEEADGPGGDEEDEADDEAEEPEALEAEAAEIVGDFSAEVEKRRFINAMIAGGAVSKNYAYQLVSNKLSKISPGLPTLYGLIMAGTEIGYFATPDSMVKMSAQGQETVAGSEEMEFNEGKPVIKVRAMIFPMLVQELAKGLLELASYDSLPKDPETARQVIDKADLADEEAWSMIMGRGLWTKFVEAIGADEDEVTMNLYNRIIQLEPAEFNQVMKTIQSGGPAAAELVKQMATEIRQDMENEEARGEEPETPEEDGGPGDDRGEFGFGGDAWKQ